MIAAVVSTAIVAFLATRHVLDNFFTGTDTLTLIETSRVNSFSDVLRLFTEPLMAGTQFVDVAKFYRPMAALSYGLDYFFWQLDPFGFQLTNLLLHILVSVVAVMLLSSLAGNDYAVGWVGGILFATHPILMESVPAIDRRHDLLATLFIALSLLAFVRTGVTRRGKKVLLVLSVVSYALALMSKEIAVVLPLLILGYALLHDDFRHGRKLTEAFRAAIPYAIITVLYIAWRVKVLGGMGGYTGRDPLDAMQTVLYIANITHSYFQDLLYPSDFLGIRDAGYGVTAFLVSAVVAYVALYLWHARKNVNPVPNTSDSGLLFYFAGWLALPLVLFDLTLTFSHRSMYFVVIPFCGLLACTVVGSARQLHMTLPAFRAKPTWSLALPMGSRLAVLAFGVLVACSLVLYSPLLNRYKAWEDSARISFLILTKLAAEAHRIPKNCVIHLYEVPDRILSYGSEPPHCKDVAFLQAYSVRSWLNLNVPGKNPKVIIHSRSCPRQFYGSLNVTFRWLNRTNVWAFVKVGWSGKRKWSRRM